MEKESVKIIKKLVLKMINCTLFVLILFNIFIVLRLHVIAPFFPILFLFDFCFLIGYPLFLRYVLKKKWFECTKDYYLKIKYILLPWLIMEVIVLLYYHKATYFIIKTVMKNSN